MTDIEIELANLNQIIERTRTSARDCVARLREAPDDDLRYLIAERLPALGSMILPDLLEVVRDSADEPTLHYLAAWVALTVGDRTESVTVLREEVLRGSRWSLPAANSLGRHKVASARDEISRALDRVSSDRDNPDIAQYSAALRQVGGAISAATRAQLVKDNSSWIARAVRSDFPADTD